MKKTLLLADDSPTIQKVINLTFADEGIDVIAVSDGNAAIQHLRDMKPDLVMADVHMPGLNGYQICERLRQNVELQKVPVILLVGSFEPFDEEEAKRVGADDFLMKPFQSIRQLVSRVTALLDNEDQKIDEPEASGSDAEEIAVAESEISQTVAETHEEIPQTLADISTDALADTLAGISVDEQPVEVSAAEEPISEKSIEDDDLSDFDSEFDRKFPDAASLSSENIDTASFFHTDEAPQADETPQPEETVADEPEISETVETVETVEINETSEIDEALKVGEAPEEEHESISTPPMPENDLNRIIALQRPERISPERISDKQEEKSIELVEHVTSEPASILDLEGFNNLGSFRGGEADDRGDVLLDIEDDETPAERYVTPVTEAVNVVVAETTAEASVEMPETPSEASHETAKYDFRSPDAFDEDNDIQETFHGFAGAPEIPQEMSAEIQAEAPALVFQTPSLERIVDEEPEPGTVTQDQADGFSGVGAPKAVSQEAIDAASQKVLEQISEKVIKEIVRGIMPDIKDLIAKEIAKDHE